MIKLMKYSSTSMKEDIIFFTPLLTLKTTNADCKAMQCLPSKTCFSGPLSIPVKLEIERHKYIKENTYIP